MRANRVERAFGRAVQLLRPHDLGGLLRLASRLSAFEVWTPHNDSLSVFPLWNFQRSRSLADLILASGAEYQERPLVLTGEDWRGVVNACGDIADDPELFASVEAVDGTDAVYREFRRAMTRLGATQLWEQDPGSFETGGRMAAMWEVLAVTRRNRIPENQLAFVESVRPGVKSTLLGVPISELVMALRDVLIYFSLFNLKSHRFLSWWSPPLPSRDDADVGRVRRQMVVLSYLQRDDWHLKGELEFSAQRLVDVVRGVHEKLGRTRQPRAVEIERLEALLTLTARSVAELREMLRTDPVYSRGSRASRLSPLERFPAVRLGELEPTRYVIPNIRHFNKGVPAILEFILQSALGRDYQHARGALLHVYVWELLEQILPRLVIIPETAYRARGERKLSADLTVVDTHAKRIIGIEVKGRGIRLDTRLTMSDEDLDANFSDALSALRGLPQKIADVRTGLPEFREWQDAIGSTGDSPPILVAITREGLHLLSSLFQERERTAQSEQTVNLGRFPSCLISVAVFERAVEVAAREGRSLASLLEGHWERANSRDMSNADADQFGPFVRGSIKDSFATRFLPAEYYSRDDD